MLTTLNLSAAVLHYGLAIGFGLYYDYLNKTYPNDPVNGIETTVREHGLSITALDVSGSPITSEWKSNASYTYPITGIQNLLISFFAIK